MVTPATTAGLVIVYAPIEIARQQLERVLTITAERVAAVCGGSEISRFAAP
jgi:hypothetical protein